MIQFVQKGLFSRTVAEGYLRNTMSILDAHPNWAYCEKIYHLR